MTECPDPAELRARPLGIEASQHVAHCVACRVLADAIEENVAADECESFEDLLALCIDGGTLSERDDSSLRRHLDRCRQCRLIANGDAGTQSDVRVIRQPAPPPADDLPQIAYDMYDVGTEVARGGMGRILSASDRRIGRTVALKELLTQTATHAARFEREARVTARLQHPGVVPIYEIGRWPSGKPFYSMRMVEGENLRAALKRCTSLIERLALLPSVIAAAQTLSYAHAHHVIHRDLTPANLMIGEYGETVVIDWGLAKVLDEDASIAQEDESPYRIEAASGLTVMGAVLGTVAYMPPEQANGEAVDERADVYALGAILYHLLAGNAPYPSTEGALDAVRKGPPPSLDRVAPDAPRDLVSIASKAMARDREARYRNAGELAEELVRFRNGMIVSAHRYTRGELMRRWVRRNRALVGSVGAAAVALVVTGAIAVTGIVRERDHARDERLVAQTQRAKAENVTVALLQEQGRQELVNGDPLRALAYLDAAYSKGRDNPSLRFLLAQAMRTIDGAHVAFDCDATVQDIAVSPDGRSLVAACTSETRVWDIVTDQKRFTLPGAATHVTFSHDGRWIATADKMVRIWDATSGRHISELEGYVETRFLEFSSDDSALVISGDGTVRVWDVAKHADRFVRKVGTPVDGVLVGLSKSTLMVSSYYGVIDTFDLLRGSRLSHIEHGSMVGNVAISPDGARIVSCGDDRVVRTWDARTGHLERVLMRGTSPIRCEMSPDGRQLVAAEGYESVARIWNLETGTAERNLQMNGLVRLGGYSPSGKMMLTGGQGQQVVIDARSGSTLASFTTADPIFHDGAWTPDERTVYMHASTQVIALDVASSSRGIEFVPPEGDLILEANRDGTRALTLARDDSMSLWNTATSERVQTEALLGPFASKDRFNHMHYGLQLSGDGKRVTASAADGKALIVLDTETGATLARIPIEKRPDDWWTDDQGRRVLLSGPRPGLWDVERGAMLLDFSQRRDAPALSPDGHTLVVASANAGSYEVWDVDTRRVISTLEVGPGPVASMGFSADGRRLILLEDVGVFNASRIALWDVETGHRLLDIGGMSAALSPSRNILFVLSAGAIQQFDVQTGERIRRADVQPASMDQVFNVAPIGNDDGHLLLIQRTDSESASGTLVGDDGQTLAHLGHMRSTIRTLPRGGYDEFFAYPHFKPGTNTLVDVNNNVTVWDLEYERRSPTEIHRIVGEHVPWQVVDGFLVARNGVLRGRVTRNQAGVAAEIVAKQKPYGSGFSVVADAAGRYEIPDLPMGEYDVVASFAGTTAKPARCAITSKGTTLDLTIP